MGHSFRGFAEIMEKVLSLLNNPNHYPHPPTFILSAPPRLCVRFFPLGVLAVRYVFFAKSVRYDLQKGDEGAAP
jgi:hypothetical protein